MRGIWILISTVALLQTCTSSPVGPPVIEYMDGTDAAKVVFDENGSEMKTGDAVSTNSTNTDISSTDSPSPSNIAEAEAESMVEASDDTNGDAPTTLSPMSSDNVLNDDETVTNVPDLNSEAEQPEADSDSPPTTSSSVDMS